MHYVHYVARPCVVLYSVLYSFVITTHFMLCSHFLDGFLYLTTGTSSFLIPVHPSLFILKYSVWFQVVIYCIITWKRPIALHYVLLFQAQFVFLAFHCLSALYIKDCEYPTIMAVTIGTQNLILFVLFYNFYKKTYSKKKVM